MAAAAAKAEENKPATVKQENEKMQKEETAKVLAKLGENTRKYPKVVIDFHFVPVADIEKCIRQVKEDKLGDAVRAPSWGGGKPSMNNFQDWGRLCKELQLFQFTVSHYGSNEIKELKMNAGEYFMGAGGGEWSSPIPAWKNNIKLDKAKYVESIRRIVERQKQNGCPLVFDTEGGPLGHGEGLEAGVDIIFTEHFQNITPSLSSARGASKAYEKQLWGAWMNVECYAGSGGWGPPRDDSYTPAHQRRMMLDYTMSYISGANLIFLQDCLFAIGICGRNGSGKPTYDMNSAECKGFRKVAQTFYRYAQTHPRSEQTPDVDIGLAVGNEEIIYLGYGNSATWTRTNVEGWNNFPNTITIPGPRRYSATPYGQVDITPIRAPIEVLQKYKTLMFLGWNTMTPEIYGKLKEYVSNGGVLFMSLPQLSMQIERKPELELINNGDFRDLFGVTVKGKLERKAGEKAENVIKFGKDSALEQCKFPVGTTFEYKYNIARSCEAKIAAMLKEMKLLSDKPEDMPAKTCLSGIDWSVGVKAPEKISYVCLTGETKPGFCIRPDGSQLSWQSGIVPEDRKGEKVTFRMAAGMGVNSGKGNYPEFLMIFIHYTDANNFLSIVLRISSCFLFKATVFESVKPFFSSRR